MDDAVLMLDEKVINEVAVGGEGLGANSSGAGFDVAFADFWHQPLQGADEF